MNDKKQDVMIMMGRINRKIFTANDKGLDSSIGMGQLNILKGIVDHENITQDELANILKLDKTTVAKAVKRLESYGLITRNRSKTDLRKKELSATKKAFAVRDRMKKHFNNHSESIFKGVSENEIEMLKCVLEKIEANIEKDRNVMNDKRQLGMKVVRLIEKNDGTNASKLAKLLDKDLDEIREILDKLIMKNFVEEKNGVLNVTPNFKGRNK